MESNTEFFIWTEALGCAEILRPMLESYVTHHDNTINVFIYSNEVDKLPSHAKINPILITTDSDTKHSKEYFVNGYKEGHLGTARLWAFIIKNIDSKYLIHLDSDTIFVGEILSKLTDQVKRFGVVGSRRPYRFSKSSSFLKKLQLFFLSDCVNTHCFAFQNNFSNITEENLVKLIHARDRSLIQKIFSPTIDFFDPVTRVIGKSQGIYYLDSDSQSKSGTYSRYGDFERRMISFSAVGSGCSFFNGTSKSTSPSYEEFAVASYSLYSKYLLGKETGVEPLKSAYLENLLVNLDFATWTIRGND